MKKIYIFDTTLRDGEQSPGANLNVNEKIEIAKALKELNVDVIEAGFPVSSKGDFEAVRQIAKTIKGVSITGLARATKKDIDCCYAAIKYSSKPRIHTFIATSDVHLKYKLKKTKQQVLRDAITAVKYAHKYVKDVEFSAEDAVRSNRNFLFKIIESVIASGARIINIPDTVGYTIPNEFAGLIKSILKNVPNINKAILSVHCHNDLGLATANSLAALSAGARQVECTVNGIGERAGNASLEEIVMAIKTRKDIFNLQTKINTKEIYKTSKLVSRLTGMPVQPNKAIVGSNAFAHESGIHQHGVMCESTTYEIISPKSIGVEKSKLVLGKLSGRHAFSQKLQRFNFSKEKINELFLKFKDLAYKKKTVFDEDIEALVEGEISNVKEIFKLEYFSILCGSSSVPIATIKLIKIVKGKHNKYNEAASSGDGPIDAAFKAIDKITKVRCKLKEYWLKSISRGKDAVGEVVTKVEYKENIIKGRGVSTDIVEASIKSYLNAINKILS